MKSADDLAPHDDVIKWKHFPRYWLFVWGIHRSPVNSSHKGQWRGALMFSLICDWINGWVNNRETDWWFETPSRSLWRHCNGKGPSYLRRQQWCHIYQRPLTACGCGTLPEPMLVCYGLDLKVRISMNLNQNAIVLSPQNSFENVAYKKAPICQVYSALNMESAKLDICWYPLPMTTI